MDSRSLEGWRSARSAGTDAVFPMGPQGQDPILLVWCGYGLNDLAESYGEVNGELGFRGRQQLALSG